MLEQSRILYLDHAPIIGGAEVALLALMRTINRQRYIPLAAIGNNPKFRRQIESVAARTRTIPFAQINVVHPAMPWRLGRSVQTVMALCRKWQVDLIHTNTLRAHIVGSLAAVLTHTPLVWTLHDNTFPPPLVRLLAAIPTRVIAVSGWLRDLYGPLGLAHKTTVIYNGTDLTMPLSLDTVIREELHIPPSAPLVVNVGRLVARKAPHLFVEAARLVSRLVPEAYFILVGGPDQLEPGQHLLPYVDNLARTVHDSGLGERLVMVGPRSDVSHFYATADLLAQCVVQPEGFGMVVIEAMAAGKPVVAAAIGATPELVQDGVTGLLVPPGDVEALAKAIVELLRNKERARAMGQAGRARVETEFNLQIQVMKTEQIYQQILG